MADHTDKRKQSLYFPEEMLREIEHEAQRLDRSLSWVVQHAWRLARGQMAKIPGVNDPAKTVPARGAPLASARTCVLAHRSEDGAWEGSISGPPPRCSWPPAAAATRWRTTGCPRQTPPPRPRKAPRGDPERAPRTPCRPRRTCRPPEPSSGCFPGGGRRAARLEGCATPR